MKRFLATLLVILMSVSVLASCKDDPNDTPTRTTERSYVASYSKSVSMGENEMTVKGSVLLNLYSDNTAEIFVATDGMGGYSNAKYTGTYNFTEDENYMDVLHLTYEYTPEGGEKQTATIDATIFDYTFDAKMFMVAAMSSDDLSFYAIDPVTVGGGDGYVGILLKTSGMGEMIYAYYVELNSDNTFSVSIMQHASVMHIDGTQRGTYAVSGSNITFTYGVLSGEDDNEVVAENFVSEGVNFGNNSFEAGFNIGITSPKASNAAFLKVK